MTSEPLTLMQTGGRRKPKLPSGVDEETAIGLYRRMMQARRLDDLGGELQAKGDVSFLVPSRGTEARAVGMAYSMQERDWLYPSYRDLGAVLTRGVEPEVILSHWLAGGHDPSRGRLLPFQYSSGPRRVVPPSASPGARMPQGAGTAYAAKIAGDPDVSVISIGDAAIASSHFVSGLAFASRFQVPAVFVLAHHQQEGALASPTGLAEACGVRSAWVDGGDALAMVQSASDAIDIARAGDGPTLLCAVMDADHADPVDRLRDFLAACGLWNEGSEAECREGVGYEIQDALGRATAAPSPGAATVVEDVYAVTPARLAEQLEAAVDSAGGDD